YGNLAQAALATLSFDEQGRLALRQIGNEIGVGFTTSQAAMVRNILGRAPDRASFGVVDWPEMPLTSTNNPNTTPPDHAAELAANPRWTPLFTAPMSASNGVYFVGHATREAAHALLRRKKFASSTAPCLPPDARRCRSTGWRWPRTKLA